MAPPLNRGGPALEAIGSKLFAYDQLKRSFYMFVFQTPMAELALGLDDMAFIADDAEPVRGG